MIYFTSDLHFGHENVIGFTQRPFSDAAEMDQALIQNWNRRVGPQDEIYILGDLTMKGAAYAEDILRQLNGRKYLVRGNHDRFVQQQSFDSSLFEWVGDYRELTYSRRRFVLFHYPMLEWNHFFRGAYHLHGHQHNSADCNQASRSAGLRRFDVGVDANGFAPVSIQEILSFFEPENPG